MSTVWCKDERGAGKRPPASIETTLPRARARGSRAYYFAGRTAIWVVAPTGWTCKGTDSPRGTRVEAVSPGLGDAPQVYGEVANPGRASVALACNVFGRAASCDIVQLKPVAQGWPGDLTAELKVTDYFGPRWTWWNERRRRTAQLGCFWARPDVCTAAHQSFSELVKRLR